MILEDREMQKLHIPSLHELLSYEKVEHYPFEKSFEEERDNPIFVLHTSGSTGMRVSLRDPFTYVLTQPRHSETHDLQK